MTDKQTHTYTPTHTPTHLHTHTHTGHLPGGMSQDYNVCVRITIESTTIDIGLFINNLHVFDISNGHDFNTVNTTRDR